MLRGDDVEGDSGAHAIYWTGLVCVPNDCCKKIMDVIARLPDCEGQAADVESAYTHVNKIGGRSQIVENSRVIMSRRVDTSSTTQMAQIMGKH